MLLFTEKSTVVFALWLKCFDETVDLLGQRIPQQHCNFCRSHSVSLLTPKIVLTLCEHEFLLANRFAILSSDQPNFLMELHFQVAIISWQFWCWPFDFHFCANYSFVQLFEVYARQIWAHAFATRSVSIPCKSSVLCLEFLLIGAGYPFWKFRPAEAVAETNNFVEKWMDIFLTWKVQSDKCSHHILYAWFYSSLYTIQLMCIFAIHVLVLSVWLAAGTIPSPMGSATSSCMKNTWEFWFSDAERTGRPHISWLSRQG